MKGDFSRDSFDPDKRYGGVLFQQGRVQLDADHNENVAIHRQLLRSIVRDLIGPHGGPDGCLGFECITSEGAYWSWRDGQSTDRASSSSDLSNGLDWQRDFLLTPGRYYVGGVLLENLAIARYSDHADAGARGLPSDGPDAVVVWLEAYEHVVTALENPGLLEPALAGADTSVRVKVDWQIRLDRIPIAETFEPDRRASCRRRYGLLTARTRPAETEASGKGGYTGIENRLYRIEIHAGSDTGTPTFKWSRENGAVVCGVVHSVFRPENDRLTLQVAPLVRTPKVALGIGTGAWVELLPEFDPGPFRHGPLLRVVGGNGNSLDLDTGGQQVGAAGIRVIRRWDQAGGGPINIPACGSPISIEEGIEVVFDPSTMNGLRAGDYWLIPARTSIADIEWPRAPDPRGASTPPVARAPNGPWSDRAPIGVLRRVAGEPHWITEDLRRRFMPMAR